jgi:DNA-binding transcriptional LysR family regulator
MEAPDLFSGVLPFFHAAEALSFRRAAERMGISTAAVSKAVLKLEERLGVKLLARSSRTVTLTPEGALFRERCRDAIAAMQSARDAVTRAQSSPRGEVHVSASLILGGLVVSELPKLAARHPRLGVRLSLSDRLSRLLEEGIDVALRVGAREDSALVSRPLLKPRWVTVAAPDLLARLGAPERPEDLARLPCLRFVRPNGRPRAWEFADKRGGVRSLEVSGGLQVDHGEYLVHAAVAGLGVAQVLDFMVLPHLRDGRLAETLASYAAEGPPIHAVTAPDRARSPNVRAFLEFAAELFARVDVARRARRAT